jgi:two-component sensor histidine kinase
VHELLTNACKYGALSNDDGEVSLTWGILSGQESDLLSIQWRERGGPPVVPPTRRGFGSKLINIGLVGTGGVDVRYEPSGFAADLHASLRHLVQG